MSSTHTESMIANPEIEPMHGSLWCLVYAAALLLISTGGGGWILGGVDQKRRGDSTMKGGVVMTDLVFIRDAGPEDWCALPRKFGMGEIVQKFTGHTYGLDRDDMMYLGVETIPCTVDGKEGFFTVPVEYLATEGGNPPMGSYIKLPVVA